MGSARTIDVALDVLNGAVLDVCAEVNMIDSIDADSCMNVTVASEDGRVVVIVRQAEDGQSMTARLTVAQTWRLRQLLKEAIEALS